MGSRNSVPGWAFRRAIDILSVSVMRACLAPALALSVLGISACGGGGSESSGGSASPQECAASGCGTMFLAITDADGDFLSYTVDVVSLSLRRADGAQIQALPVSTRVDFAELVDLTEFVTAATVPNGAYTEGTLRLDYTNADIAIEANGEPVAAEVVGRDGQPPGIVDVRVVLDNRSQIVVGPGRPAWLELDFDLAASHTVDVSVTPARAVAQPFVIASVEPVDTKELRVRGPLVRVDRAAGFYTIDVRPFHHGSARLGRLEVHTTPATVFEVDGETSTGSAGLDALTALGTGTPTVAFGVFERAGRVFTAQRVHAGTSVPGPRFDVLRGNVIARDAGTLTVRGATLIRASGSVTYVRGDIAVLVGPDTRVTRDGRDGSEADAGAISIGQRIHAFGNAAETDSGVTLDATQGRVRLHLTHLWGTVVEANPGNLALDLASIDGRRPGIFDFSGTGVAPGSDADPAHYEIATGPLDLGLLPGTSPVRVFGFVTPFGTAPPDFEGRTVIDFTGIRTLLGIGWGLEGTSAPFVALGPEGIVLDMDNSAIGARHHIAIGPRIVDLRTLATPPRVVPSPAGSAVYAIAQAGRIELFADFTAFATRLASLLGAGDNALSMHASGEFEAGTSTLAASRITVALN